MLIYDAKRVLVDFFSMNILQIKTNSFIVHIMPGSVSVRDCYGVRGCLLE